MRLLIKILLIISAAALAVACGDTANSNQTSNVNATASPAGSVVALPTPASEESASARATYNDNCIRCHKADGQGGLAEIDDGATLKVPSLKEGHALEHTDAQFVRKIMKGGDGMPSFEKRLTPEQIAGLVRFIRAEFQAGLNKDGTSSTTPQTKH